MGIESQYLDLLYELLGSPPRKDRTGTGTRSLFSKALVHNLQEGFPLLTTKKIHFKSIAVELLWFLRGESNIAFLKQHGISIWDEWADSKGELGRVYGVQWRKWRDYQGEFIDQLGSVIEEIKRNPTSRRLVVSAWNPADIPTMALPPCHLLYQFYVSNEGFLDCQATQRSADAFLGLPFNIASYALLTHLVASVTGLKAGRVILVIGDLHLYANHEEQAIIQLVRDPLILPTLTLTPKQSIDDFTLDDIAITGYKPHPAIKAAISV